MELIEFTRQAIAADGKINDLPGRSRQNQRNPNLSRLPWPIHMSPQTLRTIWLTNPLQAWHQFGRVEQSMAPHHGEIATLFAMRAVSAPHSTNLAN